MRVCAYVCVSVHASFQATVENIMKEKMPKKGGRWWFSWRGRSSSSKVMSLYKAPINTLMVDMCNSVAVDFRRNKKAKV